MKNLSKRKQSIFTKTGDGGTTYCGEIVFKNHPKIEALGCLDELGSMLGIARNFVGWSYLEPSDGNKVYKLLLAIQTRLFAAGSMIACPETSKDIITQKDIYELDRLISLFEKEKDIPNGFVVQGGECLKHTRHVSFIDMSRSICRRFERNLMSVKCELDSLSDFDKKSPDLEDLDILLKWTNRLSDVLWLLARFIESEQNSYLLYTGPKKKLDYGF